jgi:hypothetical protein
MKQLTLFALVFCAAVLASGCGQAEKKKVPYALARKSGNPVVTMGKLTIAFEGIQMKGEDAELSSGFFFVPHSGATVEGGTSSVNELTIKEVPSKEENTVVFNNYSFKLIDKGTRVRIGDKTLMIDEGPQTIVVDKAGIVKVN